MKKFIITLVGGTLVLSLVLPAFVSAQTTSTPKGAKGFKKGEICSRIGARLGEIGQKVTDRFQDLKSKKEAHRGELENKWQEFLVKRTENRTERDTNFTEHFDKLMGKATTDAQKTAVTAFQTAVKVAVSARRTAVDAAVKTFEDGVKAEIDKRRVAFEGAFSSMQASIKTAIDKAKADCTSSTDPKGVRDALAAAVKTARDAFQAATKSAQDAFKTAFDSLKSTRQTAVDKATTDFKTAIEKARADLKAAFGEVNSSSTGSN